MFQPGNFNPVMLQEREISDAFLTLMVSSKGTVSSSVQKCQCSTAGEAIFQLDISVQRQLFYFLLLVYHVHLLSVYFYPFAGPMRLIIFLITIFSIKISQSHLLLLAAKNPT
jgi:hypothetical protein